MVTVYHSIFWTSQIFEKEYLTCPKIHRTLDCVCCDKCDLHSKGGADENYPTESKPKLDLCNKKKSSDFPMFTGQMEKCVFNFY